MPGDDEEKTEEPSFKKLTEAREKGNICRSQEVVTTIVFLAAIAYAQIFFFYHFRQMAKVFDRYFNFQRWLDLEPDKMFEFMLDFFVQFFMIMLPFFAVMMSAAVIGNIMQFGFLISSEKLSPNLDKLNPLKGFEKYLKGETYLEGAKSLVKLLFLFYILYLVNKKEFYEILKLNSIPLEEQMRYSVKICVKMGYWTSMFMIVLSSVDYYLQRKFFMDKLKMSKYEIKKEMKETEGDPLIKSRIRSIQMQLASKRMMSDVPKADVVVTNPTHYAVALKYSKKDNRAPVVVAKGMRLIALKIKEIAKEHKIPIVENPPLARSLYKYCKIGREIPSELYQAVAEVLAYVYKITKKKF